MASEQLILLSFLVRSRDDYFWVEKFPESVREGIRSFFTQTGSFFLSTSRRAIASLLDKATFFCKFRELVQSCRACKQNQGLMFR
ncbi:MAG: hypothetical protein CFE39_03855 [Comamonadaceae bacterium PBBC2]|nr:MAG: hypothetical protein CFE39_03855 [Comamonadaceae bacterium PBBC2]